MEKVFTIIALISAAVAFVSFNLSMFIPAGISAMVFITALIIANLTSPRVAKITR